MNALWQEEIEELEQVLGISIESQADAEIQADHGAEAPASERFRISDLGTLNWALRKLAALDRRETEITELAKAELERIENWRKKRLDAVQRSREYLMFLIEEYARKQREENPKWKVSTPYGRVSFRRMAPKWHWKDDLSLVEWLERSGHTDMIRIKKEPEKTMVKNFLAPIENGLVIDPNTGEIVPGVQVEEQPEKLVVEVDKK